jgi:dTDP-4-amino-4,6-dideoxygalactose transaminase
MKKTIPLIRPYITQELKDKVCEALDSGYLTEGAVTRDLERSFEDYIGCNHAIAVTSCTTGLEMALRALGVGEGDEVIVPDYTYPATADVVSIVGAKTIIVDVDPMTMLIDFDEVERAVTENTKAVIPVSLFGNPLDYEKFDNIRRKHGIYIIEDAACSIGADYKGTRVGGFADISVFSLHPRKFITTGEGGIVSTNNKSWADWMLSYKHFGMEAKDGRLSSDFQRIGTNYKLSNILAAVGLVQMKHIDDLLSERRRLADNYIRLLRDCPEINIPTVTSGAGHSYQSFCVLVERRDAVMRRMRQIGIEVQIGTYSLHMHKAFKENPDCKIAGDMRGSRYSYEHCLVLPMYHEMTDDDQMYVVDSLMKAVRCEANGNDV